MKNDINLDITINKIDGRAFFVGDIHGQYDLLMQALNEKGFSHAEGDTLFCLGDLVDGGTGNEALLALITEPWFFTILGNHEHMMFNATYELTEKTFIDIQHFLIEEDGLKKIRSVLYGEANSDVRKEVFYYLNTPQINWIGNGGHWFFDTYQSIGYAKRMQMIASIKCEHMPIGREVVTPHGVIGLLHAESPLTNWNTLKENVASMKRAHHIFWSREKYEIYQTLPDFIEEFVIEGVDALLLGHTITPNLKALVLGNSIMMDVGAKMGNKPLVLSSVEVMKLIRENTHENA
jgi:serine/threonine protein phosphatase 1